jgi:uncharacterized protein
MSSTPPAADRLRRAYDAFSSGAGLDWSLFDPAVRHDQTEGLFLDGVFFGQEGVRAALEEVELDWEDLSYELLEVREVDNRILVLLRMKARVRDSQAELDAQVAHVWEFRDGRAVKWDVYSDHASACRAFNVSTAPAPQALL